MSYAQKKEISGNRTLAIIMVVVLQAALGYAIITGLAYSVIKKASEDLKTFDVEEQPPPPEEPPPPPKDMPDVPPPPVTPPPLVRMEAPPPPIQTVTAPPPIAAPPPVFSPPAPPPPPAPPRQSQAKSLSGNLQGLIRSDDYPASALDRGEEGTVTVSLTIGPNGRISGCSPSGGPSSLQQATCRILTSRAKFSPAQDANGSPISSQLSQRITWRLE